MQLKESKCLKMPFFGRIYRRFVVSPKFGRVIVWLSQNSSDEKRATLLASSKIKASIDHYFDNGKKHQKIWSKVQQFIETTWRSSHPQRMDSAIAKLPKVEAVANQTEISDDEWVKMFKEKHCYFDNNVAYLKEHLTMSPDVIKELKEIISYRPGMILYFSLVIGRQLSVNTQMLMDACKNLDLNENSFFVLVPWHKGCFLPPGQEVEIAGLDDEDRLYSWDNVQTPKEFPTLTDDDSEELVGLHNNYRGFNFQGFKGSALSNSDKYIAVTKKIREKI